jgi:hypothetical protein
VPIFRRIWCAIKILIFTRSNAGGDSANWLLCELATRRPVKPDDHSEVVPLLPIPNRTVKRLSADDSAGSRVKVGHRQATNKKAPVVRRGLFYFLCYLLTRPSARIRVGQSGKSVNPAVKVLPSLSPDRLVANRAEASARSRIPTILMNSSAPPSLRNVSNPASRNCCS